MARNRNTRHADDTAPGETVTDDTAATDTAATDLTDEMEAAPVTDDTAATDTAATETPTDSPIPSALDLTDEMEAALRVEGRGGRKPIPSAYADVVAALAGTRNEEGFSGKKAVTASQAWPIKRIRKELQRAGEQWNREHADDQITVMTEPREDHPKLPPFVAFYIRPKITKERATTEGETDAETSAPEVTSDTPAA